MEEIRAKKKLKKIALEGLMEENFHSLDVSPRIFFSLYKLFQLLAVLVPIAMTLTTLFGQRQYSLLTAFSCLLVLFTISVFCYGFAIDSSGIKYRNRAEETLQYSDDKNKIVYRYADINNISSNKSYKYVIPRKEIQEVKYNTKTKELLLKGRFKVIFYKDNQEVGSENTTSISLLDIFDKDLKPTLESYILEQNQKQKQKQ